MGCEWKWGDEDWENDTCEVSLWTGDLGGRCAVWAVAGDGRIMDVDEGVDSEDTCTFGFKNESAIKDKGKDKGKVKDEDGYDSTWGKDVINRTDGLVAGSDGSAKFINVDSNNFANGDNIDLVLVFGSVLWWFFPLISYYPALILRKKWWLILRIFRFLVLLNEDSPFKKIILNGWITPYPIFILYLEQNLSVRFAFFL